MAWHHCNPVHVHYRHVIMRDSKDMQTCHHLMHEGLIIITYLYFVYAGRNVERHELYNECDVKNA